MSTPHRFLGRVSMAEALTEQERLVDRILSGGPGCVLGFECEPVVTLGVRAGAVDVIHPDLAAEGFTVTRVDRGGQATLHNPGQLVIFPVLSVREVGAKAWVCRLTKATQRLAEAYGERLDFDPSQPGLYNAVGAKVAAVGIRLRRGVSTHGIAINLHNDLRPFSWIRACGRAEAVVAHLPTNQSLEEVFARWMQAYDTEVDKACNLKEFRDLPADSVRL